MQSQSVLWNLRSDFLFPLRHIALYLFGHEAMQKSAPKRGPMSTGQPFGQNQLQQPVKLRSSTISLLNKKTYTQLCDQKAMENQGEYKDWIDGFGK